MNPDTLLTPDQFEEAAQAAEAIQEKREMAYGSMTAAEAIKQITDLSYPLVVAEEAVSQTLSEKKTQTNLATLEDILQAGDSIVQAQERLRCLEQGDWSAYRDSRVKKSVLGFGTAGGVAAIVIGLGGIAFYSLIGGALAAVAALETYEKRGPKKWKKEQEAQYNAAIASLRAQFPAITSADIGDVVLYTHERELLLGEARGVNKYEAKVACTDYTHISNYDMDNVPLEHILCIMNQGESQVINSAGFNTLRMQEPVKIVRKNAHTEETDQFIGFVKEKIPEFTTISAALSGEHSYHLQHSPVYEYTLSKLTPKL